MITYPLFYLILSKNKNKKRKKVLFILIIVYVCIHQIYAKIIFIYP